jgi:transposase
MMGDSDPQPTFYYNISLEKFVPTEHPLRAIRPLIDTAKIRELCKDLYAPIGRPSIPPEQLFLALLGGYLLGISSERKLVMELQCNMALRWFVGLDLDEDAWDASTFSQNRRRRFDRAGGLEKLFDETVKRAMSEGLMSRHVSADGTLVRANANFKSFEPIELSMAPEEYKRNLRAKDIDEEKKSPEPPDRGPEGTGNPSVDFRGEKRSNKTHRSKTDPDCRFVSKGTSGTGAYPGYTVNALMENRNRIMLGMGVEVFQGCTSEERGCTALLDRAKKRFRYVPKCLGTDKGYFHQGFIDEVMKRTIEPHIAVDRRGRSRSHSRIRMRERGFGYQQSQRCRKKIEELFGEAKEWHGLRRFRRRGVNGWGRRRGWSDGYWTSNGLRNWVFPFKRVRKAKEWDNNILQAGWEKGALKK